MVQMFGVLILSLWLGWILTSIEAGHHVYNRIVVLDYAHDVRGTDLPIVARGKTRPSPALCVPELRHVSDARPARLGSSADSQYRHAAHVRNHHRTLLAPNAHAAYLSEQYTLSKLSVIIAIAIPVPIFTLIVLFRYGYMFKNDAHHRWIAEMCVGTGVGPLSLVAAGSAMTLSHGLLAVPPTLSIILDERIGHKHRAKVLASITSPPTDS